MTLVCDDVMQSSRNLVMFEQVFQALIHFYQTAPCHDPEGTNIQFISQQCNSMEKP